MTHTCIFRVLSPSVEHEEGGVAACEMRKEEKTHA